MHKQLIDIAYNSKGSISIEEAYRMPIWLRKFTYYDLSDKIKKENDRIEGVKKPNPKGIHKMPIQPRKAPR